VTKKLKKKSSVTAKLKMPIIFLWKKTKKAQNYFESEIQKNDQV
jgi:hypothetical protein